MNKSVVIDMPKVKEMTYRKLWTWAELAKKAGITQPTIFALQSGRRKASIRTAYKIAAALDVEPSEIIKK